MGKQGRGEREGLEGIARAGPGTAGLRSAEEKLRQNWWVGVRTTVHCVGSAGTDLSRTLSHF